MEDIVGKYMYLQLVDDHLLVVMSRSALVENHLRLPVVLEILSKSIPIKQRNESVIVCKKKKKKEKRKRKGKYLLKKKKKCWNIITYQVLSF